MSKYKKLEDNEIHVVDLDGLLRLACCDCGCVHTHAFLIRGSHHYEEAKKQNEGDFLGKGEIGISIKREPRATAQLRRHKYGDLQRPIRGDRYSLKRRPR